MASKIQRRYKVVTGLSYPTNPMAVEAHRQGRKFDESKLNERRAEPGEIVDDIPVHSISWLLKQGMIELVEDEDGKT